MKVSKNHITFQYRIGSALLLFFVLVTGDLFAIDYYQRQSGNWNNPTTWTTSTSWPHTANTGTYPQAGDNAHLANNGITATITLTADAQCANLMFDNSCTASVIAMGNYDLIVIGSWTTDWGCSGTITQGSGYLQINGGVGTISPTFNIAETVSNFRVGSTSFTKAGNAVLTVTSNYDYNCYKSSVPTGMNAGSAVKYHATPCNPSLSTTSLTGFGNVCTNTTSSSNSFTLSGLSLTTAPVTVAALTGFTYSTAAGGTYTTTLSLSQSGGPYSQTIYVQFTPKDAVSYNGNIVVAGAGASAIQVAAAGSGVGSVSPTVTTPTSANIGSTTATLGGNITVDGCSSQSITERGIYYSTTNGFANGTGIKVSETGTFGTGVFTENVTGLSTSTTYYYKAYATNNGGTAYSAQGTFNNNPMTYYSMQSGNWSSPSTWTTAGCGGTINTGTYPGYGDNVVICQSHTITVNTTGLSCNNLDMNAYQAQLTLNNDFSINGILTVTNQSSVLVGASNLTVNGNFSISGSNSNISWSNGNVTVCGNLSYSYTSGVVGLNCTGAGWLILSGTSKTVTVNNALSIPRLKQSITGFTKAGGGTLTISTVFDQYCGPAVPSGVVVAIPGNTLNSACNPNKTFKSCTSGDWNMLSTWQQSTDGGTTWVAATASPIITDGAVTIQSGHTVTLGSSAAASNLIINGSLCLNTYALTGTNICRVASGGTLLIGGASNFPTGFNTVTLSPGSTVNYNNAGDQTVFPITYSNLILSGSGSKTTCGVTVSGILSLEGTAATTATIVSNVLSTTLQYKGSSSQALTDNVLLGNKASNLTIDNAAGVSLNTDFIVNNILTVNPGTALTIQPAKILTVGGSVVNLAGSPGIVIKASPTEPNGSLIFHNAATSPVLATVEMYSKAWKAYPGQTYQYQWQFFGVPVSSIEANPTFNGSWLRRYDETLDVPTGKWNALTNTSVLTPFTGYEITQDAARTIAFHGQLVNKDTTITLICTTGVSDEGQHVLANPYAAAIDIRQLTFGTNTEATIYLFNTGSFQEWSTNSGDSTYSTASTTAGQYIAIPQSSAGIGSIPYDIPSMSGFLVKATSESASGSLTIPYNSVCTKNVSLQRVKQISTSASDKTYLKIAVKSKQYADCVWLINQPGATHGFDNGWDGYKIFGSVGTPQLYALENGENFQVSTSGDFSNTYLGFLAGDDTEYSFTFTNRNLGNYYAGVYLLDLLENKTVDITPDSSHYSFTAQHSDARTIRFKIVAIPQGNDTLNNPTTIRVFSSERTIFVNNHGNTIGNLLLYDVSGRLMNVIPFGAKCISSIQTSFPTGVYIAKVTTPIFTFSERLILH